MITIRETKIEDLKIVQDFSSKLAVKENSEFDSTVNPEFTTTESGEKYLRNNIESNDKIVLIAEDDSNSHWFFSWGH